MMREFGVADKVGRRRSVRSDEPRWLICRLHYDNTCVLASD